MVLISHKYKFVFIHIPKAGGTYVTSIVKNIDTTIIDLVDNGNGHQRFYQIKELDIYEQIKDYTFFCVVRDVLDLALSFYNYILSIKNKHYFYDEIKDKSFYDSLDLICSQFNNTEFNLEYIKYNNCAYHPKNNPINKNIILLNFDKINDNLYNFLIDLKIPDDILKRIDFTEKKNESQKFITRENISLEYILKISSNFRMALENNKFLFYENTKNYELNKTPADELNIKSMIELDTKPTHELDTKPILELDTKPTIILNTIFIIGENSFLAKHLYIEIKKNKKFNIILLNHTNYDYVSKAKDEDIIINFCGVNRSNLECEYNEANNYFLQKIIKNLSYKPFLIHISSLMVYGFKYKNFQELINYQKWFIKSKLDGEQYLNNNYPNNKLCIVRPSNIYGYDCKPYYNNLVSSLVYEKISGLNKMNKINRNCIRNILSVKNLINELINFIHIKKYGIYNIVSNNDISLDKIIDYIYNGKIPEYFEFNNDFPDIININNEEISGVNIIVEENLRYELKFLEDSMRLFYDLKKSVDIKNLNMLIQPRGNMVEITDLNSKRLYKITLTQHSVRGNHYHYEQIENFYTNKDKVIYLFAFSDNTNLIYFYISHENDLVSVKPNIIHTLSNDFLNNNPELIISSTQEFISNNTPDTEYINII